MMFLVGRKCCVLSEKRQSRVIVLCVKIRKRELKGASMGYGRRFVAELF
jgi:hypothetical protein